MIKPSLEFFTKKSGNANTVQSNTYNFHKPENSKLRNTFNFIEYHRYKNLKKCNFLKINIKTIPIPSYLLHFCILHCLFGTPYIY